MSGNAVLDKEGTVKVFNTTSVPVMYAKEWVLGIDEQNNYALIITSPTSASSIYYIQNLGISASPVFAGLTLIGSSGVLKATAGSITGGASTSDLSEGTNLYWTSDRTRFSVSGTSNRISYDTSNGVFDIHGSYVGQTSITTLGTINTGIWHGTPIGTTYGGLGLSSLGSANQILGMTSAATALEYKTISVLTNKLTITHTVGNIQLDIASGYIGQSSISTLGTISTGIWNATKIDISHGGTNLSTSGTANQLLGMNATGSAYEYKTLVAGSNVSIIHTTNTITISASGSGGGGSGANQNLDTSASPSFAGLTITNYNGYLKGSSVGLVSAVNISTSDVSEGSNLYFTTLRTDTEVISLIKSTASVYWNSTATSLSATISLSAFSTSNLSEGTNLYYLDSRALHAISGTSNRISYNNVTGVINIDSAYVGQTSITTLGTIATGTWNGSIIHPKFGGTGLSTSGTANQLLGANSTGTLLEYKTLTDSSSLYWTNSAGVISSTVSLSAFSTSNLSEGTNRYFTESRARYSVSGTSGQIIYDVTTGIFSISSLFKTYNQNLDTSASPTFAGLTITNYNGYLKGNASGVISAVNISTSDVSEGSNLYYLNSRVDTEVGTLVKNTASIYWTSAATSLSATVSLSGFSTSNLSEGTNLYYLDSRALHAISGTTNQITYSNTTGVISISVGYIGQTSITTLGTISTGTWNGTVLHPNFGGTGIATSGTANQLLGANASGTLGEWKTIVGGANVFVNHTANTITISASSSGGGANQNLDTSASPSFVGLTLSGLTSNRLVVTNSTSALASNASLAANCVVYSNGPGSLATFTSATNGQILVGITSAAPIWTSIAGTANQITVTNNPGGIKLSTPQSIGLTSNTIFNTLSLGGASYTTDVLLNIAGSDSGGSSSTKKGIYVNNTCNFNVSVAAYGADLSWNDNGSGSFTTANGYNLYLRAPTITGVSHTITNMYGMYVETISAGSSSFAIKTNGGIVNFGDNFSLGANTFAVSASTGNIIAGTWKASVIHPVYGGTGLSTSGTSNQLLGANSTGTLAEWKTIVGGSSLNIVHAANSITINTNQSLDTSATPTFAGIVCTSIPLYKATFTAGENLSAGNVCYYKSDGWIYNAKADAVGTIKGKMVLALSNVTSGSSGTFLVRGTYTTSGLTTASPYYISPTTAGAITSTIPSSAGQVVKIIGWAQSTTVLWFEPDNVWVEL